MKKMTIALLAAFGAASPAYAGGDVKAHCEEYAAAHDGDASGCGCLAEAAADDQALTGALLAINTPDDLEGADDAAKAAIGACFPDAD